MKLPAMNLEAIRTIPLMQKIAFVVLILAGIIVMFYYYVVEPKSMEIATLQGEIGKLDNEIQTLTIKVKHLDELIAANKQLEIELAKKKERLPPEEEAVMLLKQVSDLGIRLGLDIKLWKPGTKSEDASKLFVRLPVNVEVTGRIPHRGVVLRSHQQLAPDRHRVESENGDAQNRQGSRRHSDDLRSHSLCGSSRCESRCRGACGGAEVEWP